MITVRLTDRAQHTIVGALAAKAKRLDKVRKAAEEEGAGAHEITDEILYLTGHEDNPGLIALVSGQSDLFDGALKDAKQLAVEEIEKLPGEIVAELTELAGALTLAKAAGIEPRAAADFLRTVVEMLPKATAGMKDHEALDYAAARQQFEQALLTTGMKLSYTSRLAASAFAQYVGWRPAPAETPSEGGQQPPEQGS